MNTTSMLYGEIAGVGKPISRVALGTMIINTREWEQSAALLDAALAHGITTLDTAHVYAGGDSERAIGRWMAERGNREQVVILSKGCHANADRQRVTPFDISADLHDSLARLQTDYVDVYMLHRDDPSVPVGPIVEVLNEHCRAGRVRAFGGSNWTHQRLQEANDYAAAHGLLPFVASSPNFGLAIQVDNPWGPGCVTITGPDNADARAWYQQTQTAIFAYSSLGRGLLSGRITRENYAEMQDTLDNACKQAYCYEVNFQRLDRAHQLAVEKGVTVPQIALAYVLNQPLPIYALVGAASEAEIAATTTACALRLTAEELAWLEGEA
ncbi:MAG: aldo/keto reductase [Armatimonadota bacterium]